MKRIILEVSNDFARKWKATSETDRDKMLAILNEALDLVQKRNADISSEKGYGLPDDDVILRFSKFAKENFENYQQSLDKLRKKAKENGLTEEILEKLLDE